MAWKPFNVRRFILETQMENVRIMTGPSFALKQLFHLSKHDFNLLFFFSPSLFFFFFFSTCLPRMRQTSGKTDFSGISAAGEVSRIHKTHFPMKRPKENSGFSHRSEKPVGMVWREAGRPCYQRCEGWYGTFLSPSYWSLFRESQQGPGWVT